MLSSSRLHSSINHKPTSTLAGNQTPSSPPATLLRLPQSRTFTVLSIHSSQNVGTSPEPSISSQFTSSIGSPQLKWSLTQRHTNVLYVAACAVAISTTWLLCSAIPMLLSFKRAAESLEKLLDVTREELPSTMAAVRLSGMEISDLTMELSDLGQDITQGVRSSTRAVRMAEEKLRSFTSVNSTATMQEIARMKTTTTEPVLAKSARGIRQGIVKIRATLQMFFALARYSRSFINYLSNKSKLRALNK